MALYQPGHNAMYSWKTIRTVSAILLLIPIIHLAFLASRETLANLDSSPNVWDGELAAYTRADRLVERPTDPILVIGGRRVLLWRGVVDLLAPKPVLMRGLGDATVNDIIFHYKRLIGFYQPATVVLLPSNSEFHIRDMKSAHEFVDSIKKLIEIDFNHRTSGHFYIFAPLKTPLYPEDSDKIEQATALLKAWAQSDDRIEVLDVNALLSDASGSVKPDYYRADGVNLNELGYTRLSMLLLSQIEQDNPDDYERLKTPI